MKGFLGFASYEEREGMYFNFEFDTLEEIAEGIEVAEEYYKKIGIEEFLLADAFLDYDLKKVEFLDNMGPLDYLEEVEKSDNDRINNLIIRNSYSEDVLTFIKKIEKWIEIKKEFSVEEIAYMVEELKINILSSKVEKIYYYGENENDVLYQLNFSDREVSLFRWLNLSDRWEYLRMNFEIDNYYSEGLNRRIFFLPPN